MVCFARIWFFLLRTQSAAEASRLNSHGIGDATSGYVGPPSAPSNWGNTVGSLDPTLTTNH
ncbi:hypothetical protein FRB91_000542 [Serendipita sp. 411]|nr:hypothetical protein FRB91_000542 [Serendipita sp. 411]